MPMRRSPRLLRQPGGFEGRVPIHMALDADHPSSAHRNDTAVSVSSSIPLPRRSHGAPVGLASGYSPPMDSNLGFYEISVELLALMWVVLVLESRFLPMRSGTFGGWRVAIALGFALGTGIGIVTALSVLESGVRGSETESDLVKIALLLGAGLLLVAPIRELIYEWRKQRGPNRVPDAVETILLALFSLMFLGAMLLVFLN
jgi:hypothetical protein